MATRDAACHCGQLRLEVAGDPLALSICNCLACQRRTGSAFGMQAAFKADQVQVVGRFDAHPDQAYLYYNVACCESLAGRTADAIEHLRQSIDMWEGCRDMAREELRLRSNLRRPCVRGTDRPLGIKSRRPASSFHSTSSPRALAMDGRPERRLAVLNASRAIFPALSLIRAGVAELVDAAGLGPVGSQGPWRFESSRPHRLGVNGAESGYIRSLPASIDRKEARRCTSAAASSR
jgi:hypothetical protein